MATGAAGDGIFRGIFEGCIGNDMEISQRPYHRNCSCALHKSRGNCSHVSKSIKISYPIRRSWSEGCLALMSSATPTLQPSPGASPAEKAELTRKTSMVFIPELDQD